MWWAISLVVVGVGALIVGVGIGLAMGFTKGMESSRNYEFGFVAGRKLERRIWGDLHPEEARALAEGKPVVRCDNGSFVIVMEQGGCSARLSEAAAAPQDCSRGAEPPLATNRAPQGGGEQRKRRSTEEIIRAHEEAGR